MAAPTMGIAAGDNPHQRCSQPPNAGEMKNGLQSMSSHPKAGLRLALALFALAALNLLFTPSVIAAASTVIDATKAGVIGDGMIQIKSNITLRLAKDATLLSSSDIADYFNLDPFLDAELTMKRQAISPLLLG